MEISTHKLTGYMRPPRTDADELERLVNERRALAACAERNAAHYARILRGYDEQIAALRAEMEGGNDKNGV